MEIIADKTIEGLVNGIAGANCKDKHYTGVTVGRDFTPGRFCDIKTARPDDLCIKCGSPIEFLKGIETGHIFQLGTKYSGVMGANFLDAEKQSRPYIMGCYGIGVTRIVAAAIEQNHDKDGIIWPTALAPYKVVITLIDAGVQEADSVALQIYSGLRGREIDTILDDRIERPGVKFKDADLIGFPLRVNIGLKRLKEGKIEVRERKTGITDLIAPDDAVEYIVNKLSTM
jgi:prolyl-tRNA synthetase